jgi:hypothetical protein
MDVPVEKEDRGNWLWKAQDTLVDRACVSAAYHGKRERFYNVLERIFQAFTAITATAAFAEITGKGNLARWFALAAAIASILPLVFSFAENARKHGQLKAGFKMLLSSMYAAGVEFTEEQFTSFKAQVADLEAGEPAALAALVIQCQNEIAAAKRQRCYPLTLWEWLGMHFYSFDPTVIVGRAKASP